MRKAFSFNHLLLLLILLIGLGLRVFNFGELSLGNDELSVLSRIQYNSFSDLIEIGVKPDVHPAGIQVLAYYWTALFGDSPFALRFPFILAGLVSIFIAYKIGENWLSVESGLLTAACMASLQYFISLGVYARPYALVLCFGLGMVYFLAKIIQESDPSFWIYGAYAICSVFCLYFHYFSFLLVGSAALMGLLFVSGEKRKSFLISLFLIPLFYLPHMGIFIHHLEKGGSEWIGKPGSGFFLNYLFYAFHYSYLFISFLLLSIAGLFIWKGLQIKNAPLRNRIISASLFCLPLGLGYLYSVLRAPVLHSNGLLASFPFFLLFLFSFVPKLNDLQRGLLLMCVLLISCGTLIMDRQHFDLFYNRSAEALVANIMESEEDFPDEQIDHLLQLHAPYYADYYLENEATPASIKAYDLADLGGVRELRKYLRSSQADKISLGWLSKPLPDYFIPVVREFYPGIEKRENFFISESWLFSRDSVQNQKIIFHKSEDKSYITPGWNIENQNLEDFSETEHPFSDLTFDQEFGPTLELSLEEMELEHYHELWADIELKTNRQESEIKLVVEYLPENGESIWHASQASQYISEPLDWNRIHFYRRLQHLGVKDAKGKLKMYPWNPAKESYSIKRLSIQIAEGNPWLYGLVEKLP